MTEVTFQNDEYGTKVFLDGIEQGTIWYAASGWAYKVKLPNGTEIAKNSYATLAEAKESVYRIYGSAMEEFITPCLDQLTPIGKNIYQACTDLGLDIVIKYKNIEHALFRTTWQVIVIYFKSSEDMNLFKLSGKCGEHVKYKDDIELEVIKNVIL